MSDDADPDAELKTEICAQLAEIIINRVPGISEVFDVKSVQRDLLTGLQLELVQDKIDRQLHHREKDELFSLAARSAFGHLISFGKPVEELVKDGQLRRRILDAALVVAQDQERTYAGLIKSADYDITQEIESGTTRVVCARRRARSRAHSYFVVVVTGVWLAVAFTPLAWEYGVFMTIGAAGGTWWAKKSFNPYGRRT
jgi:hypothetical protein